MTVYLTADTHFGHSGILSSRMSRPRPFASIEEHDEALIAAWNNRVRPTDVVWHLGDFAYGASAARCREIFNRLNGTKHLIRGNHDQARTLSLPWASQQDRAQISDRGATFVMDHYALRTWHGSHRGVLHLYGHSHGSLPGTAASLDVGVDCWAWRPVTTPEVLEALEETRAIEAGRAAVGALAEAA
ncbi:MAG: metallophosphoesterase [Parafilimonas terrae]|nr:metallophosphoesterase [Parafilimonas terrae]